MPHSSVFITFHRSRDLLVSVRVAPPPSFFPSVSSQTARLSALLQARTSASFHSIFGSHAEHTLSSQPAHFSIATYSLQVAFQPRAHYIIVIRTKHGINLSHNLSKVTINCIKLENERSYCFFVNKVK